MSWEPIKRNDDLRRDWISVNQLGVVVAQIKAQVKAQERELVRLSAGVLSGRARLFRLKSVQPDYLICRTWDGDEEGTEDIFVAKNYKLRNSIEEETIDSVTYNYTYTSVVHRVSTPEGGGASEQQYVVPRWLVNDLIWAIPAHTLVEAGAEGQEQPVVWLDLNLDGRAWATPSSS